MVFHLLEIVIVHISYIYNLFSHVNAYY